MKKSKALGFDPALNTLDFYHYIVTFARLSYEAELLHTRNLYSLSIFKKTLDQIDNTVLVHDHNQCELITKLFETHDIPKFDKIFVQKEYNGNFEEMMEKIVILSHIDDRYFRNSMEKGVNPLKFMFKGMFKNNLEEVKQAFMHFNKEYSQALTKGFIQEIERIPTLSKRGRKIHTVHERAKEIESRDGFIQTGYLHKQIEQTFTSQILYMQIQKNIEKKQKAGISQIEELYALEQLSENKYNAFNIEIIKKLVVEANAQLGLKKLPDDLKKYEKMLVKTTPKELLKLTKGKKVKLIGEKGQKDEEGIYLFDKKNPPIEAGEHEPKFQHMVIGEGELPIDIKGKSPDELKELGFKEIYQSSIQSDNYGRFNLGSFSKAREALKDSGKEIDINELLKEHKNTAEK